MTRYFDAIDLVSLASMIALSYVLLTFGPLP